MAIDLPAPPGAKLPLWHTIGLSYSTYFHNFPDVLRASWLCLLVAAATAGIANWLDWTRLTGLMMGATPDVPGKPVGTQVIELVLNLVALLALVSIAVAWHRRLILGEPPGLSGGNVATKAVWRCLWAGIAIVVMCFLPVLAIAATFFLFRVAAVARATPGSSTGAAMLLIPVILLFYFAGIAVMLRLSLVLPARAVEDLGLTFRQSWNRTRGNAWRILWGLAFCMLPPLFAAQIVFFAAVGWPELGMVITEAYASRMAVSSTVLVVYYLLIAPIGIGFLSHAYRHFFQPT